MTRPNNIKTPWTLDIDRYRTEHIAIICDDDGDELVRSRTFWFPDVAGLTPPTLAAMLLMVAAPKLLEALEYLLAQTVDMDLKNGVALSEGEQDARAKALAAIALATTGRRSA